MPKKKNSKKRGNASPFKDVKATSRTVAEESPGSRATRLVATVRAAGDRLDERAAAFATAPLKEEKILYALHLEYALYRVGLRRTLGALRKAEAADGRPGWSEVSKELRTANRARLARLRSMLRRPLALRLQAPGDDSWPTQRVTATALELRRDLNLRDDLDGRAAARLGQAAFERIGTVRRRQVAGKSEWWIVPHLPGLPNAALSGKHIGSVVPGLPVFYRSDRNGAKAVNVRAISESARRNRTPISGDIRGLSGPREPADRVRGVVSGGGGPGTGRRR